MSAETTTAQPYAICTTEGCGVELADQEAAEEHRTSTMAPTGEAGVVARSHSTRVVNPTPEEAEEQAARRVVAWAIESAQERAFEDIDRDIRNGAATEEAVTKELRFYPDFADAWDEWRKADER